MMIAIHGCCQSKTPTPAAEAVRPAARGRILWLSGRALSSCTILFAFLLPKCPLCFAAWAAALGVGAAGQHYLAHPWLRPLLIGLLAFPLLMQLALAARFRLRRLRKRFAGQPRAPYPFLCPALSPSSLNRK